MEDLKAIIESLLFVADKPLSVEKLVEIIEEADARAIRSTLQELLREFDNPGRGFRLHEVAGGYQFRTHPECQAYIRRMLKPPPSRLSRAALETLAIVAYKQPIIRSDIEHIRGVDSGGVLRVLMEKKLVRVLGRREIPGRPLIYATTKHFLEVFDLKNLKDLPTPKEIEELTAQEPENGETLVEIGTHDAGSAVSPHRGGEEIAPVSEARTLPADRSVDHQDPAMDPVEMPLSTSPQPIKQPTTTPTTDAVAPAQETPMAEAADDASAPPPIDVAIETSIETSTEASTETSTETAVGASPEGPKDRS